MEKILLLPEKRSVEKLDINNIYKCVHDIASYDIFYLHFSNKGFK